MTRNIVLLCILLAPPLVGQQQVGKVVDPRLLERPRPLCTIKATEVRPTLQLVVTTLHDAGYAIVATDWDHGEVEARLVANGSENRIIAWLERDIAKPTTQFSIYFVAGRYEKFFGTPDLRRVLLNTVQDDEHFGALRRRLIAVALTHG